MFRYRGISDVEGGKPKSCDPKIFVMQCGLDAGGVAVRERRDMPLLAGLQTAGIHHLYGQLK